jgi:hypothetical protein
MFLAYENVVIYYFTTRFVKFYMADVDHRKYAIGWR